MCRQPWGGAGHQGGLFREQVDPQTGGKVPEAARHRLRLNMIDHLGLRDPEAVRMAGEMVGAEPGQDLGMSHCTAHYNNSTLDADISSLIRPFLPGQQAVQAVQAVSGPRPLLGSFVSQSLRPAPTRPPARPAPPPRPLRVPRPLRSRPGHRCTGFHCPPNQAISVKLPPHETRNNFPFSIGQNRDKPFIHFG